MIMTFSNDGEPTQCSEKNKSDVDSSKQTGRRHKQTFVISIILLLNCFTGTTSVFKTIELLDVGNKLCANRKENSRIEHHALHDT